MALDKVKLLFDDTGELCQIVFPSETDDEIAGEKHDQPGLTSIIVDRAGLHECFSVQDALVMYKPDVEKSNPKLAVAVEKRIADTDLKLAEQKAQVDDARKARAGK